MTAPATVVTNSPSRVLLIEDNEEDFAITANALHVARFVSDQDNHEFVLQWARTLADGIDKLTSRQYDVILLDMSLPDADELQGLKELRQINQFTPVVVLTANESSQLAVRALRAGAQDYLIKSEIDADTLSRALRYAVERNACNSKLQRRDLANATNTSNLQQIAQFKREIHAPLSVILSSSRDLMRDEVAIHKRVALTQKIFKASLQMDQILTSWSETSQKFVPNSQSVNKQHSSESESTPEMQAIVENFSRVLPQRVQDIRAAFHSADWDTLHYLSHRLINASLFGYQKIGDLSRSISKLTKCDDRAAQPDKKATYYMTDRDQCSLLVDQLCSEVSLRLSARTQH